MRFVLFTDKTVSQCTSAINERAWGAPEHHCGCNTSSLLEKVRAAMGRTRSTEVAPTTNATQRETEDPVVAELEKLDEEAKTLLARGKSEDARDVARQALDLRREAFGPSSNDPPLLEMTIIFFCSDAAT